MTTGWRVCAYGSVKPSTNQAMDPKWIPKLSVFVIDVISMLDVTRRCAMRINVNVTIQCFESTKLSETCAVISKPSTK